MHDLPPQGSIDDIFLPRLVAGLHLHEFEGTLRLNLPDVVKVLYFKKGEIASAASNAEPDRLANILIQEGRLTTEQLDLARARMQPAASLGKTLIELGFLTPTELLHGARRQVQVIVASCFTARSGAYEMVPGPLPTEVSSLGVGTRRLLFDCLMQAGDRAVIIHEIGSMEAVYRPTGQLNFVLASLKLDFETDRIARLLNGAASLRDLSSRTSHDDFTVSKVVLALDLLGGAERVASPQETAPVTERGRAIPITVETQDARPAPATVESLDDDVQIMEDALEQGPPAFVAVAVDDVDPSSTPPPAVTPGETIDAASPQVPPAQPIDSASHLFTPVDPAADEPPPIPQDELPAFAQSPGELTTGTTQNTAADGAPQWEIDPETGERVHVGPIEMTFDGRIAAGRGESRNLMRILLGAGAVTLVVGGALGYVILRRGEGRPTAAPPPVASTPIAPEPLAAKPIPRVETGPPAVKPALGETDSGPASAGLAAAQTGPSRVQTAPPTTPPVPSTTKAVPPPPAPARPQPGVPRGEATPLTSDPRFASALRQIDQGDAAGAARQFESWIVAENPDRFTLQIMIACQEDTVMGARSRAGPGGSLYILPYSLKGRPCYRVCWGVYLDGDSARAAAPAVPPGLAGSTVPLVVPLSRLRSSG